MEAVRTSETSVDNNFTRQYIPEDNSEHHTRRRENLKSHKNLVTSVKLNLYVSSDTHIAGVDLNILHHITVKKQ
jgi:hypothetical protein